MILIVWVSSWLCSLPVLRFRWAGVARFPHSAKRSGKKEGERTQFLSFAAFPTPWQEKRPFPLKHFPIFSPIDDAFSPSLSHFYHMLRLPLKLAGHLLCLAREGGGSWANMGYYCASFAFIEGRYVGEGQGTLHGIEATQHRCKLREIDS